MATRFFRWTVFGGLGAGALIFFRRLSLLVAAGWSVEASTGGLLYTLLDFVAGGILLLVFLPLARGRRVGVKVMVYALGAAAVKLSWSATDWGMFPSWFTIIDLALGSLGLVASLLALRWLHATQPEDDFEEEGEQSDDGKS